MHLPEDSRSLLYRSGQLSPEEAQALARETLRRCDDGELYLQFIASEAFGFDDVVLNSKLIDGTFPDYQRVIPTGNDKVMEVDRKTFAEAVDRVSTISSEKSRAVKMSLKSGSLTLSANSPETGSASEELEVKYGGTGIDIGFNSRYLLDITEQIEGDGAQFSLADGRLCSPGPMQYAVTAAVTGDRSHQDGFRRELQRRAALTTERLNQIPGMSCVAPKGAFYAMPKMTLPPGRTDRDYVLGLLRATGILVVYGSGFGTDPADGFFRVVFLASPAELGAIYDEMAAYTFA